MILEMRSKESGSDRKLWKFAGLVEAVTVLQQIFEAKYTLAIETLKPTKVCELDKLHSSCMYSGPEGNANTQPVKSEGNFKWKIVCQNLRNI